MKHSVNQIILLINTVAPSEVAGTYPYHCNARQKTRMFILHIENKRNKKKSSVKTRLIENFNLESDRTALSTRISPHNHLKWI